MSQNPHFTVYLPPRAKPAPHPHDEQTRTTSTTQRHAPPLPHGRLLRTFLRRCTTRRKTTRHHTHPSRPIRRRTHSDGRCSPITPSKTTSPGSSNKVNPSPSANKSAIRRYQKGPSNAKSPASLHPAHSATKPPLKNAKNNSSAHFTKKKTTDGIATLDIASGRFHILEINGEESLTSELERLAKPCRTSHQ